MYALLLSLSMSLDKRKKKPPKINSDQIAEKKLSLYLQ